VASPGCRSLVLMANLLAAVWTLSAQASFPRMLFADGSHDVPERAQVFQGSMRVFGALESTPHFYLWQVDDADSDRLWNLELQSDTDGLIRAEILALESDPGILAEAGVAAGWTGSRTLLTLESRANRQTARYENIMVPPGEYYIGLADDGGGGSYQLVFEADRRISVDARAGGPDGDRGQLLVAPERPLVALLQGEADTLEVAAHDGEGRVWRIEVAGELGISLAAELLDDAGQSMATLPSTNTLLGQWSRLRVPDASRIRFRAGEGGSVGRVRVGMYADGTVTDGWEIEPNDLLEQANWMTATVPFRGTLTSQDRDFIRFEVDAELAVGTQSLSLDTGGQSVNVCLGRAGSPRSACRIGTGDDLFAGLRLDEGQYHLSLELEYGFPETAYAVHWVPGPEAPADQAILPNDLPEWASPLVPRRPARGVLRPGPVPAWAWFELVVEGEPQFWRFQANGPDLQALRVVRAYGGSSEEVARAETWGQANPRIDHVLLLPGRYRIGLTSTKVSDYMLRAIPLGPPSPGHEQEPNDSARDANELIPGLAKQGNFHVGSHIHGGDRDFFRFDLPGDNRVELRLTPPIDGPVTLVLSSEHEEIERLSGIREPGVIQQWLEAGQYVVELRPGGIMEGDYRLEFALLNPLDSAAAEDAPVLDLALKRDDGPLAGEQEWIQRTATVLVLDNASAEAMRLDLSAHGSHQGWAVDGLPDEITLAPGEQRELELEWRLPPGLSASIPVTLFVNAGSHAASIEVPVRPDVEPLRPLAPEPIPSGLVGLTNLAWGALGAEFVDPQTLEPVTDLRAEGIYGLEFLIDNQASTVLSLQHRPTQAGEALPPLRLAGAGGAIRALVFNQRSVHGRGERWSGVHVEYSLDGQHFDLLLETPLKATDGEQVFTFEAPVEARYLRVRPTGITGSRGSWVGTGLVQVLGEPSPPGIRRANLLDPAFGGHVVYTHPDNSRIADFPRLRERERALRIEGNAFEVVFGFFQQRAALLSELGWQESDEEHGQRIGKLRVERSLESPVGPWTHVADWELQRDASGYARLPFEDPIWARYLRFVLELPEAGRDYHDWFWIPPTLFFAYEGETAAAPPSIVGFWGQDRREGPYEAARLQGGSAANQHSGTPNDRESHPRAPWVLDGTVVGQVEQPGDVRSYAITVPPGRNALHLTLDEPHGERMRTRLQGPDGNLHEPRWTVRTGGGREAWVTGIGEGEYRLDIERAPRSVVFMWDGSGSLAAKQPAIYQALRQFGRGLVPGREVANLMPLGGPLLIEGWAEYPIQLTQALAAYNNQFDSSESEPALRLATRALEDRDGERVIILITDAQQGGRDYSVWRDFERVRPRIFAIEIAEGGFGVSSSLETFRFQQMMQNWAAVGSGQYRMASDSNGMVRAMEDAMRQVRRPAVFSLAAASAMRDPPRPGQLVVVSGKQPAVAAGVVHLIFDASGSMLRQMEGGRRIDVARKIVRDILAERLPPDVPVALRAFGHIEPHSCETELLAGPGTARDRVLAKVDGIRAINLARTPLAASLQAVPDDLGDYADASRLVVLLTDGEETCEGDVEAAVAALVAEGVAVRINIVGFHIDDAALRMDFERWAELGGGTYFDSRDGEGLVQSLRNALAATWQVLESTGEVVARGVVDDDAVELESGEYTLVISSASGERREVLRIEPDASVRVEVNP
jgi:hypothetical protein